MRFGISSTIVKDRNIFELLDQMKDCNIKFVEIRLEKNHFLYEEKSEIKKLKSYLKEYGIKALSLHPPDWTDIGNEDEHLRIKSVREVEKSILVAHHLNAERVILHPSNSQTKMEYIIQSILEIKNFAEEWKKEILLENAMFPKTTSNLMELKQISDNFNINICFDTSHYFSNSNTLDDIFLIIEKIKELHISDSLMDKKDDHLFPGKGRIEWNKFFNILNLKNKEIDIIIEIMPEKEIYKTLKEIEKFFGELSNG